MQVERRTSFDDGSEILKEYDLQPKPEPAPNDIFMLQKEENAED